ncbi:MAG: DHH family phosphoesterase [Candidatus Methanoplasma sp.]|jgi:RecJ-like exonuclease|nr:DHH family phosphoesterase [Candidatus Methanoplasma sp.]
MDGSVPSKLLTTLSHAAEIVRGHDFIHVFSHYDADGISAAAVVAKALFRAGKEFKVTLFTSLNDHNMDIIRNSNAECVVVTDLGASYIKQFDELTVDVVILDHHTIYEQAERICYANPHLYGIDGMTSGCGATMAFLFAITLDEKNWDLVQVAFAGIAGDRQHINGLLGLNAYLFEEGKKKGFIVVSDGSLIPPRKLSEELFLTTDPYIRGVSGNKEGVTKLLDDAKVPHDRNAEDLSEEEKQRLSSLIALKLTGQKVSVQTMFEVSRTRYYLPSWKLDAETFSSILNGCGRMGLGGIGVAAGMGDKNSLKQAETIDDEYRKQVVEGVLALEAVGLTQLEHIQWFDSSASGFTGILCGIAMQFMGDPAKPTIGINRYDSIAKISSRGMWGQLEKGIDLSIALKSACESVGGTGGGHKIASGGSCPTERSEEFLSNLDKIIAEQLSGAK